MSDDERDAIRKIVRKGIDSAMHDFVDSDLETEWHGENLASNMTDAACAVMFAQIEGCRTLRSEDANYKGE